MTSTAEHETLSKTARAAAGMLRVLREDVDWVTEKVVTSDLTADEASALEKIILALDSDVHHLLVAVHGKKEKET